MYSADPGPRYGIQRVYGSRQTDVYEPMYSRVTPEGITVTRWKFSEAERRLIAEGKDLFITIQTFSTPMQPHGFMVEGTEDNG